MSSSCRNTPGNEVSEREAIPLKTSLILRVRHFDALPRALRKSYGYCICCAYYMPWWLCSAANCIRVVAIVAELYICSNQRRTRAEICLAPLNAFITIGFFSVPALTDSCSTTKNLLGIRNNRKRKETRIDTD